MLIYFLTRYYPSYVNYKNKAPIIGAFIKLYI